MNKSLKDGFRRIDPATTIYPFLAIFVLCLFFILNPAGSTDALSAIRGFLGDELGSEHQLELTWLADRKEPYNLGDNEFHLALRTDDYEAAHAKHEQMGCICYENTAMGIYFIVDPDGYWVEILPPVVEEKY